MRPRSIRARITMLAAAIASIVLATAAVIVVLVVQTQLRNNLDRALEQRADQIERAALADSESALLNTNQEDRFAQVLDSDGQVVLATENVAGAPALSAIPEGDRTASTRSDLPIEDDVYRVLIQRFEVQSGAQFVVVGENIDDVRDGVRALMITLAVVFPAAVVALAAAVWWLVGRTLRPVEQIRTEVAGIGLTELGRRVPVPGTGDEVDRLAGTMNDMLARLETASAHQRQFVADVSHELRTPLTRMRTALEVDLASDSSDLAETCRNVLGDSIDMQALVDDLLFLAHRDAGEVIVRRDPVDLDVVIGDEVRSIRSEMGAAAGIAIDISQVSAVLVRGNRRHLERLVRNIVSNAVRHANRAVSISASTDDAGVATLLVDDDGPGIPIDQRQRVFERFVRLDEARHRDRGGSGLGLAIARDIVVAHHGTIEIGDSPMGGARFVVMLS